VASRLSERTERLTDIAGGRVRKMLGISPSDIGCGRRLDGVGIRAVNHSQQRWEAMDFCSKPMPFKLF